MPPEVPSGEANQTQPANNAAQTLDRPGKTLLTIVLPIVISLLILVFICIVFYVRSRRIKATPILRRLGARDSDFPQFCPSPGGGSSAAESQRSPLKIQKQRSDEMAHQLKRRQARGDEATTKGRRSRVEDDAFALAFAQVSTVV